MNTRQIPKLGNIVRDVTTGFTGTAFQYVELMTGTVQLSIQPLLKEGESHVETGEGVPPAISVDLALLDYVGEGIIDRVQPAADTGIKLGDEVEDIVAGLRGIAIIKTTFINGCVYFNVQPKQTEKQKKEGEFSAASFLPYQRLRTIGAGVSAQVSATLTTPAEKRPGGPSTRAQRA